MSVAFSTDGRRLASAGADSLIRVWEVESKACRLVLRGHADEVFAAIFHPDGSRIASGGRDRLVRLWDTATGEELVRLPGHANYVYSLAFSPDGTTLASSSGDHTIRLWDTAPLKHRYQARREVDVVRPEAERLVERLFTELHEPDRVAAWLQGAEDLSDPLHRAALGALLRRGEQARP
jgi:WD40 repeat protein